MKKHMFQRENVIYKDIFAQVEVVKAFMKTKEDGKRYIR